MNFTRTLFPLSMLLLSGCVVGPDYQKPDAALPVKFSESRAASAENVTLNPWWESFRDRRLNDLVHQGMAENLTVRQALERIEAAEANVIVAGSGSLPSIGLTADATASGQDGSYLRRSPGSGGDHSESKSMTAVPRKRRTPRSTPPMTTSTSRASPISPISCRAMSTRATIRKRWR